MTFPICPDCAEFSSLLIRQLTDLLQIENKSANNAPKGKCKTAAGQKKKDLQFKIRYAFCCCPSSGNETATQGVSEREQRMQ